MKTFIPQNLYGVIGWPLAQTLSPLIHNAGFQAYELPAVYLKWEIRPEKLNPFMEAIPALPISGCSVTIPYKRDVLPWLESASEAASLAGAANTLIYRDGALHGDNTDVGGFLRPLEKIALDRLDALILGCGGAARAVAAGLKLKGCRSVRATSPSDKSQFELGERFNFQPVKWAERYAYPATLIINCAPLGMKGEYIDETPYDFALAPPVADGIAYDLVYNPPLTRFLRDAEAAGRKIVSGIEMFFYQASGQFKLWTGRDLPESVKTLLYDALDIPRAV